MIGRRIENTAIATGKTARINNLTSYIREPEREGKTEKCVYHGSRNFIFDSPEAQTAEMIALAQECKKSKDPIEHHVFSWQEGEQPTFDQIEEAVSIIMKEYGLENHQTIYGLHSDTDNWHLHLAINRVHPDTGKIVDINNRFTHEAIHKAVARIEKAQGWRREEKGRYVVLENENVAKVTNSEKKPKPSQKKIDKEIATGEKSVARIIQEIAQPIIGRVTKSDTKENEKIATWKQFHDELLKVGITYEKFGGGAIFRYGDTTIKASEVSREASLSKMVKLLGTFIETNNVPQRTSSVTTEIAKPQPIDNMPPEQRERFEEYATARAAHNRSRTEAREALKKAQEAEWGNLLKDQEAYRYELTFGNWKGKGAALNALRAEIAQRMKKEQAEMKERHRGQARGISEHFPDWPRFEDWLKDPKAATQYRHAEALAPTPTFEGRAHPHEPRPRTLPNFTAERINDEVHYSKSRGGGGRGVSFVDQGTKVNVIDWKDPESVLAALQLAQQKWPEGFTVTGEEDFKARCAKIAARHNLAILNPEMQEAIKAEKTRIDVIQSRPKPKQLTEFEKYSQAVNADRYRVTVIKFNRDSKDKQTFLLDKQAGISLGFTPEEIADHTAEMIALQERGENIYYTPLSENKHHILIDDLKRESLERFIADGYQPAVIIESSPNNFQAIITIPKLGTDDKDVANAVSKRLNQEYGDKNLSGAIHPHRAPAYENRKPSHQREDHTFPEVKLRKAERRECPKTLALAESISLDYQNQPKRQTEAQQDIKPPEATTATESHAYIAHYNAISRILKNEIADPSRVDSMIALRLRATGHSEEDIEKIIFENAPTIPQRSKMAEKRNWLDYARRTARYAFTPTADHELSKYAKYKQQWINLEKTQTRREQPKAHPIQVSTPTPAERQLDTPKAAPLQADTPLTAKTAAIEIANIVKDKTLRTDETAKTAILALYFVDKTIRPEDQKAVLEAAAKAAGTSTDGASRAYTASKDPEKMLSLQKELQRTREKAL